MLDNYYLELDICNRFCHKTIHKFDYNLIKHVTLKLSFDHMELSESNDIVDLVNASLSIFNFETNSKIDIKTETKNGNDILNTCSHEIFVFNKKKIKLLLNKFLIANINFRNLASKKASSIFCFEIFFDTNDFQIFFPEAIKKKLNYNVPKLFLKVYLKKDLTSFLHF